MSKSSITTERVGTPDRVTTHPGEVLAEEFLRPLGLSVHALALALRVPATRVGAIVKGERSVSADTALRLARYFGTSAEFWIGLQAMHDLTKTKSEVGETIALGFRVGVEVDQARVAARHRDHVVRVRVRLDASGDHFSLDVHHA